MKGIQPPHQAIIDIGSNSIRLVVYGGPPRAPALIYNEKIMAGLGRGVVASGRLDPASVASALNGLARFAALLSAMQPEQLRVVATAAVREAADGGDLLGRIRALGLPAELLSGEDEAVAAGYGVISALPGADGLVADMGGGSLELVRVAGGEVHQRTSLPFGALRIADIRSGGPGRLRKALRSALAGHDWIGEGTGRPLYLVGGSWRALARVQMHFDGWPLPLVANHTFPALRARLLKEQVRGLGLDQLRAIPGVKASRAPQLDDAAAMLAALAGEIEPDQLVVSAYGLREGLLYQSLDPATRLLDPLIESVRHFTGDQQQWAGYPESLLEWGDAAFPGEAPQLRRLRHAVCLIAGTGWVANADFRAVEGEEMALHGAWSGATAIDRAVMAMGLHVGLGGDRQVPPPLLAQIAPADLLERAAGWGLALRLAHRLSGGNAAALAAAPLRIADDGALVLAVPAARAAIVDGAVERRITRLALALGRKARIETLPDAAFAPENAPRRGGRRARA